MQTPEQQWQVKGSSASMACRMDDETILHWYKQLPGEPPKRILYVSGQSPVFDDSGNSVRFQVRKHPTEPLYGLTIPYVTPTDSGTYYCAYWLYEGPTQPETGKNKPCKKALCALNGKLGTQMLPYSTPLS